MRDRRSAMTPPEMMNGSASGSTSSNSSAPETCIRDVEEMQLAAPAMDQPARFASTQLGDHPVVRVEQQLMQDALRARAVTGRVLVERQLEHGVQLHRLASSEGVGEHTPPRIDPAGPAEARQGSRAGLRTGPREARQHAQITIEQIAPAVREIG